MTSAKIKAQIQKLEQDAVVHLYELDLTEWGDEILRFCSDEKEDVSVFFGGDEFSPRPVSVTGFAYSGEGPIAQPVIQISNIDGTIGAVADTYGDLIGVPFRRIRTFREHLDDGSDPDVTALFPIDAYKVEQKTAQNPVYCEFTLSANTDQEGMLIPGRQVLKNVCTFRYRRYDSTLADFDYSKTDCPYAGTDYFDETGAVVAAAEDSCNKQLSACKARFGSAGLPFSGFPGVGQYK